MSIHETPSTTFRELLDNVGADARRAVKLWRQESLTRDVTIHMKCFAEAEAHAIEGRARELCPEIKIAVSWLVWSSPTKPGGGDGKSP